jgi:hypothetical protein
MLLWSRVRRAVFVAAVLLASAAPARCELIGDIQQALYAGHTQEAAQVAQRRLALAPGDDQARMALGAVQFLQAVENLGRALHRYGLRSEVRDGSGLLGLPILRLPIPANPNPERITYDAFRDVLRTFANDLKTADGTLATMGGGDVALPLDLGLIRLDLKGDGAATADETLLAIFERISRLGPDAPAPPGLFLTDFDASDAPWLRAYCNLLMAIAEFPLAYDWRETFDNTFQGVFPNGQFATEELAVRNRQVEKELNEFVEVPQEFRFRTFDPEKYEEWKKSPAGIKYERYWYLARFPLYAQIADLIAFLHLAHWQVVEPKRLADVLDHLQTMIAQSRENWRRIMADTNPGKRWIPNPNQQGIFTNMRVTPELVAGWQAFLDQFQAVLEGRMLIPHWRFDKGINVRRFLLEPRPLDIVMLAQGRDALPYLEDGELMSSERAQTLQSIFHGDFLRYFLWFN